MKKKEFLLWGIVIVLLVSAMFFSRQRQDKAMAINFVDGSSLGFGVVDGVNNSSLFTFHDVVEITGNNTVGFPHTIYDIDDGSFTTGNIEVNILKDTTNNKLSFLVEWDKGPSPTSRGYWQSNGFTFQDNTKYQIDITYDMGSAANDPIFYINGSPISITEVVSPVAPAPSLANNLLWLGGESSYSPYSKIISHQPMIYNLILSANEILEMNNSRGKWYPKNGLVFCPFMNGAAGLQSFDGAALASGNTILDPCSGAIGVPYGSPVGVGETYLSKR